MKITFNNREEIIDRETLSVEELLEMKKFTFKLRVVKINGVLIKKDQYAASMIKEGDNVSMMYLMSGG